MPFRSLTQEDIRRIDKGIENVRMFVEDVIEDPSILEHIPDQTHIELTPIEESEPGRSYLVVTSRLAVAEQVVPVSLEKE